MPDTISLPLLASVQIASPCPARWEDMTGDDLTRLCAGCNLHIHNLTSMTSDEAETFLRDRVGSSPIGKPRVCIRFFRRADGTILTRDCPVGLALWRKRVGWAIGRVAAACVFLATGGYLASSHQREGLTHRLRAVQPFRTVCEWFNPTVRPILPPPVPPPFSGGIVGIPLIGHLFKNAGSGSSDGRAVGRDVDTSPESRVRGPLPIGTRELPR